MGSGRGTRNVVTHQCGDNDGADQLDGVGQAIVFWGVVIMCVHTCQTRRPMANALDTIFAGICVCVWKDW